jgi:hypothetical protein
MRVEDSGPVMRVEDSGPVMRVEDSGPVMRVEDSGPVMRVEDSGNSPLILSMEISSRLLNGEILTDEIPDWEDSDILENVPERD